MLATLLLTTMLGCTTRVHAVSTDATATVQVVRGGPMPQQGANIQGTLVATGTGQAMGTTSYVVGRRFWVVADAQDGTRSVVRMQSQAKAAPIVGCAAGTLLAGLLGAWGCLYVAGPTSHTVQVTP